MNLFNREEDIIRTIGEGYIDDNEDFVAGATEVLTIKCSIQPYREGKNSFNSPTGYRTIDVLRVYSCTSLIAADEYAQTVGDQLTYEGKEYFCKDLEKWSPQTIGVNGKSMIPEHWLGYFYRKDRS